VKTPQSLCHALLDAAGVRHGFGVRGSLPPPGTQRPRQVHGSRFVVAHPEVDAGSLEADAIVSRDPAIPVAIVTADCVPILATDTRGEAVVAIHAGWRGLAAGIVEAGIEGLRENLPRDSDLVAVLGPHIGPCCYEVDTPVLQALGSRFDPESMALASHPTRPGHARISLTELTHRALSLAGVSEDHRGTLAEHCTACGIDRFYSYRREAGQAGRLVHYIAPKSSDRA
jgi:YfiH family protein